MTREECIALLIRYAEYDGMGIPNLAGCREAMRMAAELLSQPSLPSNLDEAAEEYGRKEYSHAIHFWDEGLSKNKPEVMKEDFVDSFKAGAEWMARQGVNLKCWIARDEYSGDESDLYIGQQKPRRVPGAAPGFGMWCDYGEFMALPIDMFPELAYSDEPIEVELIIRKK